MHFDKKIIIFEFLSGKLIYIKFQGIAKRRSIFPPTLPEKTFFTSFERSLFIHGYNLL